MVCLFSKMSGTLLGADADDGGLAAGTVRSTPEWLLTSVSRIVGGRGWLKAEPHLGPPTRLSACGPSGTTAVRWPDILCKGLVVQWTMEATCLLWPSSGIHMALPLSHSSTWHSCKLAQIAGERTETLSLIERSVNDLGTLFPLWPLPDRVVLFSVALPCPLGLYQHWLQAVLCGWRHCIAKA